MRTGLRLRLLAALCLVLAAIAGSAPAAAQRCPVEGIGKKVLFARPTLSGPAATGAGDVAGLMAEMQFAFEIERERRWRERASEPVAFLLCEEGGLLARNQWLQRVHDLYQGGVLLEVRSVLHLGASASESEAMIQYALVPTGFFFREGLTDTDGIYGARTRPLASGDYIEVFVNPLEIDAFVALGLGVSHRDIGEYDFAYSNFCSALRHLRSLPSPGFAALGPSQQEALKKLKLFLVAELEQTVEQGLGKATGATITLMSETHPDTFAADPCLLETSDG
jgi:hypothetical protein